MNSDEIGQIVSLYRKRAGLSQAKLARWAGVGKTVIFDIEKGKPSVQVNTLMKVCAVLNIKITLEPPFPERNL